MTILLTCVSVNCVHAWCLQWSDKSNGTPSTGWLWAMIWVHIGIQYGSSARTRAPICQAVSLALFFSAYAIVIKKRYTHTMKEIPRVLDTKYREWIVPVELLPRYEYRLTVCHSFYLYWGHTVWHCTYRTHLTISEAVLLRWSAFPCSSQSFGYFWRWSSVWC